MKIPIFYNLQTGWIQSYIIPSNEKESELINLKPPDGQAVLVINEKEFGNQEVLQGLVNQVTGLVPVEKRYAVVDPNTGDVKTATIAPEGTILPDVVLIEDDQACEGWKLENGVFVDHRILPTPVIKL